MGLMSLL